MCCSSGLTLGLLTTSRERTENCGALYTAALQLFSWISQSSLYNHSTHKALLWYLLSQCFEQPVCQRQPQTSLSTQLKGIFTYFFFIFLKRMGKEIKTWVDTITKLVSAFYTIGQGQEQRALVLEIYPWCLMFRSDFCLRNAAELTEHDFGSQATTFW